MKITYNNLIFYLVAIDVLLFYVGAIIPGFKDIGFFEYMQSIPEMIPRDQFLAYNWILLTFLNIISWIGLCLYKNWSRISYTLCILLCLISAFVGGNGGWGPGIYDAAMALSNIFYGFFICMLFFSPLSDKFSNMKFASN